MASLSVMIHSAFFLVLVHFIHVFSDNFVVQNEVGLRDKFRIHNSTCQVASSAGICKSFGAQKDVGSGNNCSCICPQENNTFGFDGKSCKCLPGSISYGGCSQFSHNLVTLSKEVLYRGSKITLSFSTKNCSLSLWYRNNNGSWITERTEMIAFGIINSQNEIYNFSLVVSNSTERFYDGVLFNVVIQCDDPNHNSSKCFLLKLSSSLTCPFAVSLQSKHAQTTTAANATNTTAVAKTPASSLSKGALVAIIVSCLAFLILVFFLVLFLWLRRKRGTKNKKKEGACEMAGDEEFVRKTSDAVIFPRPSAAIPQRKDSANEGFEPDNNDKNAFTEISDEPDYDLPIDEKHSIISDFINKVRKPRSMKNPSLRNKQNEPIIENESEDYQIMNPLDTPENTVVYENTKDLSIKDQSKGEAKQPSYKKIWRPKRSKKDKKPKKLSQKTRDNKAKRRNGDVPQLTVPVDEIPEGPKNENNTGQENFYENNQVIQDNLRNDAPPRTPIHKNRASYSNDVQEEEEGPPPPPRSTSLEKVLDEPRSNPPVPSPRIKTKVPRSQDNDGLDNEIGNEMEIDSSELYENTRGDKYHPKPLPRGK